MSEKYKFTSSTKFNYYRGLKNVNVKEPGSTFYPRLFGNAEQENRIYGFLKNHPPKNIPPEPPVYNTKIVALLDFNDIVYDQQIIKTLNYYFTTVPRFYQFPIVNTEGKIDKIISLLDEYYEKGYRYFYGFTITPLFFGVQEWFNNHPEAQGVCSASRYFTGNPSSVFRLQPQSNVTSSIQLIEGYDSVFTLYNETNEATILRSEYIKKRCEELGIAFYSWAAKKLTQITDENFVDNTMEEIDQIIKINNYKNASIISIFGSWQDTYYNKFVFGTTTTPINSTFYNSTVFLPKITEPLSQRYFTNVVLYAQTTSNLGSAPLWRKGLEVLGQQNYSTVTLNAMELLYKLDYSNGYSDELGSYNDSLIFDYVTRDQQYDSVVFSLYSNSNIFIPKIIYYKDTELTYKGFVNDL